MTNTIAAVENLLISGFIEESKIAGLDGFDDFKRKNFPLREYSPMAEGYVYCQREGMGEVIESIEHALIVEIYEGYRHSHLPMRTVRYCIEFAKRRGFSEVFAKNLISSLKLKEKLYSFPSVFGEPEEDWVTPHENVATFMKELFSIDLTAYKEFLEELEVDSCNLGNELICSNNPAIERFLNSWTNTGDVDFLGSGSTKTLVIKGRG